MNLQRIIRSAAAAAILVSGGVAAADEGAGTVYGRDNWPGQITRRSLTLPVTMIDVKVPLVVNLSKDSVGEPWFVAPAVALGFTDDITLRAYTPERGTGFCLAGSAHGCEKAWNDVAAEVIYAFSRSAQQMLALRTGVEAYRIADPMLLALKIGGTYKLTLGNVALVLGGDFRIGLTERDAGNIKETLTVFAEPQLQLTDTVGLFAELEGEVELQPEKNPATNETPGVGDTLRVPFGVGLEWEMLHRVSVGGKVRFANLFGRGGTADARELVIFGEIFF